MYVIHMLVSWPSSKNVPAVFGLGWQCWSRAASLPEVPSVPPASLGSRLREYGNIFKCFGRKGGKTIIRKDGSAARRQYCKPASWQRGNMATRGSGNAGDLCRQHGISEATFYAWKSKFGTMTVSEARRLEHLEEENRKLKKLLAEAMLDNAALKDIASGNF